MAKCDMASNAEAEKFADNKSKILSTANTWNLSSRKYLEAVLNALEMMTAYYSYGNGEITIEDDSAWDTLAPEMIIPMINEVIKPQLGIEVSNISNRFPTTLWFEIDDLMND